MMTQDNLSKKTTPPNIAMHTSQRKKVIAHLSHGVWIDNNCKNSGMWWKKGKHFLGGPMGYKCMFLHLF
jgi:hypothetical protein